MGCLFEVCEVVSEIRRARNICRKRRTWSKSILVKFEGELALLRKNGASLGDLQYWLRINKRVKVHRSTIKRFLDKYCS